MMMSCRGGELVCTTHIMSAVHVKREKEMGIGFERLKIAP